MAKMKRMQQRLQRALLNIGRRREASEHPKAPRALASISDPDSRFMPSKEGGYRPNYSAQIGVDAAHGVIVAAEANDRVEDAGQLVPMLNETQRNCGVLPNEASADSSYNTGPDLAALERMGVTGYLPENNERSDGCPMGQPLTPWRIDQDRKNWGERLRQQYKCSACQSCPHTRDCCINPVRGRTVGRDQHEECRERLKVRMATTAGLSRYRLRAQTVEPRIGLIKHVWGVRRFLHRGMDAVRTEWLGVCTAVNVSILLRHWDKVQAVL